MSGDPQALAELLRAARPDIEPSDLTPDDLDALVVEVGGDPTESATVGAALVAWERMLP